MKSDHGTAANCHLDLDGKIRHCQTSTLWFSSLAYVVIAHNPTLLLTSKTSASILDHLIRLHPCPPQVHLRKKGNLPLPFQQARNLQSQSWWPRQCFSRDNNMVIPQFQWLAENISHNPVPRVWRNKRRDCCEWGKYFQGKGQGTGALRSTRMTSFLFQILSPPIVHLILLINMFTCCVDLTQLLACLFQSRQWKSYGFGDISVSSMWLADGFKCVSVLPSLHTFLSPQWLSYLASVPLFDFLFSPVSMPAQPIEFTAFFHVLRFWDGRDLHIHEIQWAPKTSPEQTNSYIVTQTRANVVLPSAFSTPFHSLIS